MGGAFGVEGSGGQLGVGVAPVRPLEMDEGGVQVVLFLFGACQEVESPRPLFGTIGVLGDRAKLGLGPLGIALVGVVLRQSQLRRLGLGMKWILALEVIQEAASGCVVSGGEGGLRLQVERLRCRGVRGVGLPEGRKGRGGLRIQVLFVQLNGGPESLLGVWSVSLCMKREGLSPNYRTEEKKSAPMGDHSRECGSHTSRSNARGTNKATSAHLSYGVNRGRFVGRKRS